MKKILVIDDEADITDVLKSFLENEGYVTFVANNVTAGLKKLSEEKPDVVLMDVLMPQIDGLECLKKIRTLSPETIVIIMSGLQNEEVAKQAIQEGAYDFITKPFDFSFLRDNLLARIFPDEN